MAVKVKVEVVVLAKITKCSSLNRQEGARRDLRGDRDIPATRGYTQRAARWISRKLV